MFKEIQVYIVAYIYNSKEIRLKVVKEIRLYIVAFVFEFNYVVDEHVFLAFAFVSCQTLYFFCHMQSTLKSMSLLISKAKLNTDSKTKPIVPKINSVCQIYRKF